MEQRDLLNLVRSFRRVNPSLERTLYQLQWEKSICSPMISNECVEGGFWPCFLRSLFLPVAPWFDVRLKLFLSFGWVATLLEIHCPFFLRLLLNWHWSPFAPEHVLLHNFFFFFFHDERSKWNRRFWFRRIRYLEKESLQFFGLPQEQRSISLKEKISSPFVTLEWLFFAVGIRC